MLRHEGHIGTKPPRGQKPREQCYRVRQEVPFVRGQDEISDCEKWREERMYKDRHLDVPRVLSVPVPDEEARQRIGIIEDSDHSVWWYHQGQQLHVGVVFERKLSSPGT